MSISDFYAASLGEVLCVVRSFYNLQEQKERAEWERIRFLSLMIIKPHDTKRKFKKPSDILPFPWEQSTSNVSDANDFLAKAEAKAAETQKAWIEDLKRQGLLDTIN